MALARVSPARGPALGLPARQRVLLVHGLGRTAGSMRSCARFLDGLGFEAWVLGYPSREAGVERLCETRFLPALRELNGDGRPTHVVSHSLGGILARMAFAREEPPAGTRIVMLAPPNAGCPIVDRLGRLKPIRLFLGPAGMQLGEGADAVPRSLPPLPESVACLVIAGSRSGDPWFNFLFDGDHDGKVSVESSRMPAPAEHAVVRATHTFVMNHPEARAAIARFLGPASALAQAARAQEAKPAA